MYWLLINNGKYGPFTDKGVALDKYRTLVHEVLVVCAQLWYGTKNTPVTRLYTII